MFCDPFFIKYQRIAIDMIFEQYPLCSYVFLPKCHPDLNPIEMLWGFCKKYISKHTNFTISKVESLLIESLTKVNQLNLCSKWVKHCNHILFDER